MGENDYAGVRDEGGGGGLYTVRTFQYIVVFLIGIFPAGWGAGWGVDGVGKPLSDSFQIP